MHKRRARKPQRRMADLLSLPCSKSAVCMLLSIVTEIRATAKVRGSVGLVRLHLLDRHPHEAVTRVVAQVTLRALTEDVVAFEDAVAVAEMTGVAEVGEVVEEGSNPSQQKAT